jgi:hypothetical protein
MKPKIDFSEVNSSNKDTFYLDVLTNSRIKTIFGLDREIDLYFFEEFYIQRNELIDKVYFEKELDNIITCIDNMSVASGKETNTQELIDKKNEILELLDFEFISFIDIRRIHKKIKTMNSIDKLANIGALKTIKINAISQLPIIHNTIKVIKHYKIIDGKAIPVPMEEYISLKRPKSGNNIYITTALNNARRVYIGFYYGPRAGIGYEYTFEKTNNKWAIQNKKLNWIS